MSVCPPSYLSSVKGWNRPRQTGKNCRRSCAGSRRRGRSWSAQSPSSSNRWPCLARWEAAPLLLLPLLPEPLMPTLRPPLLLSQRPQRLAKSNCHPSRHLPPLFFPWSSPANSTDTNKSACSKKELHISSGCPFYFSVGLTFVFVI